MSNYVSKMLEHGFTEEIVENSHPYLAGLKGEELLSYSELVKYSFTILHWIWSLFNCFESLEHTRVYMNHFRSNKWYREAGIVQGNYINYHYKKYAITVVTVMDVCLILTNTTFRLGNPERLCYLENITKNSWVTSAKVDKALNKLGKIVEPWREPRNLFIHRGYEPNRETLTRLEIYEQLLEKGLMNNKDIPLHRRKTLYKAELADIFKEFDQVEPPLFNAVIELLTKLQPIYKSWQEKLQTPS